MPTYPEIGWRLPRRAPFAGGSRRGIDHVHRDRRPHRTVRRAVLLRARRCFATSFHTRFPDLSARFGLPVGLSYAALHHFPMPAAASWCRHPVSPANLSERGFRRILRWSRGVDHARLHPTRRRRSPLGGRFSFCGRNSRSENIEAFLALDLPGIEARRGRRPGARRARSPVSAGPDPRRRDRRRLSALTPRRMFRLSEPHRHIGRCCCSELWPAACRSRPIR